MTSPWQPPDQTPVAPTPPPTLQYGEMAPPGYVSPVAPPPVALPPLSAPTYYATPPVARKSRTADIAVTCVLLAFGLIGLFGGLSVGLTLHQSLAAEASRYGVTYQDPANLGGLGAFIVISHIVLFLAALGISIALMVQRRLAFWVPLAAGVIAAIILWSILLSLILGDPALMSALTAGKR
jgi:Family of unknown function (DUF6264)